MKTTLFLIIALISSTVFGQGDAPPFIQGQSQTTKSVATVIKTPNNQTTKLSSSQALLETGNKNRLVNPGFEHQTIGTGWSTSFTGGASIPGGLGAAATPFEGSKSIEFTCVGGPVTPGSCTIYQDVATGFSVQALASIHVKPSTTTLHKVYARRDGANTSFFKDMTNFSTTGFNPAPIPIVGGTTSTGIAVEIVVGPLESVTVALDEGSVGYDKVTANTSVVGPWTTGTCSSNWVTNTTVACKYRQNAQSIDIQYTLSFTGLPTPAATLLRLGLPSGFSMAGISSVGGYSGDAALGATYYPTLVPFYDSATTLGINYGAVSTSPNTSTEGNLQASVPVAIVNGNTARINVTVQVQQLSASNNTLSSTNGNTSWASCGHTTSDFTGFGTVTNIETQCKRDGDDLLMRGKFTAGTSTAVEARLALKFNGQSLTSKNSTSIPSIQIAGKASQAFSSTLYFGESVLIEPSVGYITFGSQTSTSNDLSKANGSSLASGNALSITARIPINGWENSNVIVASLKDIPTTIGSTGSDVQTVFFGSGANCNLVCTTGACNVCHKVGTKITSAEFNVTGSYRIYGINGLKYNCSGSGFDGTNTRAFVWDVPQSTSTYATVYGVANSAFISITCIGIP